MRLLAGQAGGDLARGGAEKAAGHRQTTGKRAPGVAPWESGRPSHHTSAAATPHVKRAVRPDVRVPMLETEVGLQKLRPVKRLCPEGGGFGSSV